MKRIRVDDEFKKFVDEIKIEIKIKKGKKITIPEVTNILTIQLKRNRKQIEDIFF